MREARVKIREELKQSDGVKTIHRKLDFSESLFFGNPLLRVTIYLC